MKEIKIETAQDLIDAIAQHPQFREEVLRHLLTQELLQLPAKFEQFQEEFGHFREKFGQFREEVLHRLDVLEGDVSTLKSDVSTLKDDTSTLKTDVSTLKTDVSTLQGDTSTLKSDVSTLKGHVADLRGKDYERSIRFRVRERAAHAFTLSSPRIAFSQNDPLSRELDSAINRAKSRNEISIREIESLLDTDIIISDDENNHTAVEASLTADERDVTRARERADILSRITGGTAHAIVVAQTIPDEMQEKAATLNVAIMQLEYRG